MAYRLGEQRSPSAGWRVRARLAAVGVVLALALGPLALTGSAAGALTMDARILLQGHARVGGWAAIEVDLKNDGPRVEGELQMDGGTQSSARYAMAVKLETGSHQTYVLHVQPPAFGRNVKIDLVSGGNVIDSVTVAYLVHEATQLVVGVVAERPAGIVSELKLPANAYGTSPAVITLGLADLPERAEGWSSLDRLIWQDVDSNQLTNAQLTALRQWIAGGGRLVIVGGTAGIGTLSAFPDDLLPFRPTATLDLDPTQLVGVLGPLPAGAAELPAMAGAAGAGKALATSGDRVVAADLVYGNGHVTILGFDPTVKWLATSKSVDQLWRGLLPERASAGGVTGDDSQIVQAVSYLPALALPPTSGLLVIIAAYILIIGPINYLILKRLDRRELAWVTMPVLVLTFAAASFGYGAFLRGTDIVVNEVAIVQGAPNATEATANLYFGIFSPTRSTYQVNVPQGALLASPLSSGFGQGVANLDILQGTGIEQPSGVRNLAVGTGSIRIVRAELPVAAPLMKATLNVVNGVLTGTFENASDQPLEAVAIALGNAVAKLGDVEARGTRTVKLVMQANQFGSSLADQIIGPSFDQTTEAGVRRSTRYSMLSQLTYDPMTGNGTLAADQAVILAFTRETLLDVAVGSESPRRIGNVLYYVPVAIGISGSVTFQGDLLRSNVIDGSAQLFNRDRLFLSMGLGSATLAYRPLPYQGTFTPSEIRLQLGGGDNPIPGATGKPITPLAEMPVACQDSQLNLPKGCQPSRDDQMPDVEVFDRSGDGAWVRLPRMDIEGTYSLTNPARYIDPVTGQLLVRFVNDNLAMTVGFGFQVALSGTIR